MRLVRASQAPVPPTTRGERGPWCPNHEAHVLGSCGHVCLGWGEYKAVRSLCSWIYCDVCQAWVKIQSKKVTAVNILGLDALPLPVDPPF
jgi:hypothetical protein